ncbi:MAG: hypothetical protein WBV77_11820, partial [Solirubrobacteraceae bacterium]
LVNQKVKLWANVDPYPTEHSKEHEAETELRAELNTVEGGHPATVNWRYITRGGKYVLVSYMPEGSTETIWGFIERQYLASDSTMCVETQSRLPDEEDGKVIPPTGKGEPTTDVHHQNWPIVCTRR